MALPPTPATAGEVTASAAASHTADTTHSAAAKHTSVTLAQEVLKRSGLDVARCLQCGKCSAGCPMATETSLRPHEIMLRVMRNRREELLASDGIWLCLTCTTCSTRCPNNADPARVIDVLREIAMDEDPSLATRAVGVFNQTFLAQVESSGRMHEVGLVAQYNIRTGHLLKDAAAMPALLLRGKFKITPESIKNTDEVRRIFRNVNTARRNASRGDRS
jgi:heterodisulfide reductase subunit C2